MKNKKRLIILKSILKLSILVLFIIISFNYDSQKKNVIKTEILNLNKVFYINANADKEFEDINKDIYAAKESYSGDLTGYAADCPMCNGTLACKSSYNVYKNGVITYDDKTYGTVRIVASSKKLACGSIIRFSSERISNEDVFAIVLDRGVLGTNIDLLVQTEAYASENIGRSKIDYDVVRIGW